MLDVHGLIFAYQSSRGLGELVAQRTSASLPFCSRYRLIDFALSSMTNAGVRDVGVVMHRDYQSLLRLKRGQPQGIQGRYGSPLGCEGLYSKH